ncbi:hypothetical protein DB346_16385 [Verrucomicrobia bacterium LW23]|nr:hypothetical protein DB346_16385 [Verrucomicrobia bacterium LW23]
MKNMIILAAGLGLFVLFAIGGLAIYVSGNKGLGKGIAASMMEKKPGPKDKTYGYTKRELETIGDWDSTYMKKDDFKTVLEENYYDDKTFRCEFMHTEYEPLRGTRGQLTVKLKILARGDWYCTNDRIILKMKSIPVLHVYSVTLDAPDVANQVGTGVIEQERERIEVEIQRHVISKKEWLMGQTWYMDIMSSDGTKVTCRDRTGKMLSRVKKIKPKASATETKAAAN